jgi:hypothetical protein
MDPSTGMQRFRVSLLSLLLLSQIFMVAGAPSATAFPAARVRGTSATPSASPPPRAYLGVVTDAARRLVLFGGRDQALGSAGFYDDTWTWNGTAWTEQHPAEAPSPRCCFSVAYDAASRQVVLFGASTPATTISGTPGRGTDPPGPSSIRLTPHPPRARPGWPTTRYAGASC